jgi:hypothetical protein
VLGFWYTLKNLNLVSSLKTIICICLAGIEEVCLLLPTSQSVVAFRLWPKVVGKNKTTIASGSSKGWW